MKNGLGAIDRSLNTLETYAVEDDIPINDAELVRTIVADGKEALDAVRELVRATTVLYREYVGPLDTVPATAEAFEVRDALDRLTKAREGARR